MLRAVLDMHDGGEMSSGGGCKFVRQDRLVLKKSDGAEMHAGSELASLSFSEASLRRTLPAISLKQLNKSD